MKRLSKSALLPTDIAPRYQPEGHGVGIVHLGLGAFAKAHLADYTDRALAASGGDWRILGISLRAPAPAQALNPQDGRYTLITRSASGTQARVIGALAGAQCSAGNPAPALAAMTDQGCRIVSLTVTEKAYGLDRARLGCDTAHPAVAADLAAPDAPQGVLGMLTRALALRRARGLPPFTVLCCDNLPENGTLLAGAVVDYARHLDADLADWIAQNVAFPSTMVDRITPAATTHTLAEAASLTGYEDQAAVECEDFCQWVIADNFPQGRPDWAAGGAIFVPDVTPYEAMKLRMLNGTHSMLAYAGYHAGCAFVRDVMQDAAGARLVARHLAAARATLPALAGLDLAQYADDLRARFANPALAHETFQIAMDGTEKLPQRIFAPALDALARGQDLRPFAFATAAWMRHASGATHDCAPYALRDPRAAEIAAALVGRSTAGDIAGALMALQGWMPAALTRSAAWPAQISQILHAMLTQPMRAVLQTEAAARCG